MVISGILVTEPHLELEVVFALTSFELKEVEKGCCDLAGNLGPSGLVVS